jgi:hypothetical protein
MPPASTSALASSMMYGTPRTGKGAPQR